MMMHRSILSSLRLSLYLLVLGAVTLSRAEGNALPETIAIGLQTKQAAVRLSGLAPILLSAGGQDTLPLPANLPIVCTGKNGGIAVQDANGIPLYTVKGILRVAIDPAPPATRERTPDAPAPLPQLRLLGPGRHYDGKPDRPYRGYFELLPKADGITVVNIVPLEAYLWGVVSSEMSPRYPLEALKAQAIAARTYAARNIGRLSKLGFDLDDTAACQVYGGVFSEDPRTTRAVNETAGMVLTYGGKIIDAVYSSTCGGFTESAEHAWGTAVPYLQSVADCHPDVAAPFTPRPTDEEGWAAFCKASRGPHCLQPKWANPEAFRWVRLLTRKELETSLGLNDKIGTLHNLTVLKRGASGRITALKVEGTTGATTLEKELAIRKALGGLRSSAFTVDIYRDDAGVPVVFAFWGGGWGHGLGMCQVGAVGLADEGWAYNRILEHYYTGVKIERR
ncbi:MAG TPA: SpoIID/LytB domain-containing protein [Armatimonadota bacterium]|mgnify:CR=1 FL=1|nr:SpoIID/LytB domain-containing protein [Armatimonadota bacterium]